MASYWKLLGYGSSNVNSAVDTQSRQGKALKNREKMKYVHVMSTALLVQIAITIAYAGKVLHDLADVLVPRKSTKDE